MNATSLNKNMKKEQIYYGSYGFQFREKLTEKQKTTNFQTQCNFPFSTNNEIHLPAFFNAINIFFTIDFFSHDENG